MDFKVKRKVSFTEEAYIEADSMEEAKELLKKATLDWDVDFEWDPTIESIIITDDESGDEEEFERYRQIIGFLLHFENKEKNNIVLLMQFIYR